MSKRLNCSLTRDNHTSRQIRLYSYGAISATASTDSTIQYIIDKKSRHIEPIDRQRDRQAQLNTSSHKACFSSQGYDHPRWALSKCYFKVAKHRRHLQHLREEEQRLREEEQRLREAAEKRASASQPLSLSSYLGTCHTLRLSIDAVTDRSLTTQGDANNPAGRFYPRRIIPWGAFPKEQEKVWADLAFSPSFTTRSSFPSRHQLEYVKSLLHPISSEIGLRNSERDVVENAVQKLMDATYTDTALRKRFGLNGSVTFESHTNLGITDESISESVDRVSPFEASGAHTETSKSTRKRQSGRPILHIPNVRRPEAPSSRNRPQRDVINQEAKGFGFEARRLTTAVVTQLFSYMIGKGIQYGYVCTGETYIFLHIPTDPSCVYYSACVPNLDVEDDDENRLHRTAVAQVYAFVLQAVQSPLPSQAWHNAADSLDTWDVEYEDVLRSIPATNRKAKRATPYRAQRWKGFTRSPIRTRSRCMPLEDGKVHPTDDDDGGGDSPSPTPNPTGRSLGDLRGTVSSEAHTSGRSSQT
ncbi:hypothetical protein FSARC_12615 [Fusarium sarcochroum]|uniref:Uncharacterized protein n=1 Tax=Fusarium sarcochroum TaxID=1208366 RepID=A0A8H4WVP9_9HYPO|nr:hypothetical protein FSARC_12615 [Fusarium sarcochroum]